MSTIIITITGPESSGKTTLAELLAKYFGVDFIPEYAREYLNRSGSDHYSHQDFQHIAQAQIKRWEDAKNLPLLIKDTDLTVLKIWEQLKFKKNSTWLEKAWATDQSHFTFLCKPDFEWVPDPLRENPHDRDRLFTIYLLALLHRGYPFYILTGDIQSRFEKVINLLGHIE